MLIVLTDICNYWYFLDKWFKFKPDVCRCHDVLIMSINPNNIAILNICGVYYHCIPNGISGSLWNIFFLYGVLKIDI